MEKKYKNKDILESWRQWKWAMIEIHGGNEMVKKQSIMMITMQKKIKRAFKNQGWTNGATKN